MNTIGLLLVLGLAFYALKQKSEKTRNMLLVVSALIGFCMFSAEGFTVDASQDMTALFSGTMSRGAGAAGGTGPVGTRDDFTPVIVQGTANRYTFTGNNALDLVGGTGAIPDGITCNTGTTVTSGEVEGVVGYNSAFTPADAATLPQSPLSSIDTYLTCVPPTTACPAKAVGATAVTTQDATCGPSKTYKTTISATDKYTGLSTGDDYKTKCCETPPGPTCAPKKTVTDGAAAIKTQNDTCGNYKKYKTVDPGTAFTGVAGSTSYLTNCCEDNCTTDKCDKWNLFGLTCNDCEACEEGDVFDTYCSDPDLDNTITYLVGGTAALLVIVVIVAVITGKKSASK